MALARPENLNLYAWHKLTAQLHEQGEPMHFPLFLVPIVEKISPCLFVDIFPYF